MDEGYPTGHSLFLYVKGVSQMEHAGNIIIKPELRKLFQDGWARCRVLFCSAPCGFGKTTTVTALLEGRTVQSLSAADGLPSALDPKCEVVLLDDVQLLQDCADQEKLCDWIRTNREIHFVLLSRGIVPGWLLPFQFSGFMCTIESAAFLWEPSETGQYLAQCGISVSPAEAAAIQTATNGYALAMALLCHQMQKGVEFSQAVVDKVRRELYLHFETAVYRRFELPMRQVLISLAPFEQFNLELAQMVSGEIRVGELLSNLRRDTTMLLSDRRDQYHFWPIFQQFLLWELSQEYSVPEQQAVYSRAGLYYELRDDYAHALDCYEKSGEHRKVSALLVKNAELHPGVGRYYDMERYYYAMPEDEILRSPSLMCGICCYVNIKMDDGQVHRKKLQFSYLDRENEQVLITHMDITDIYAQEQNRMTQLRDAVQAAQRANSVKTDFLARMSHDLRTPMNAVIGLAELAQKELTDPSPADPSSMEYYVSNIISSGKLLLGLVNDCLDFEKISQNRMQLHLAPCSYAAFRQSISTMVTPLCQAKKIEFIFGPNTTSYTVRVDPVRLEQIFMNLLTNAVKFTPEGGKIEFLTCHHNRHDNIISCDFIVRDNGIGISPEFQKHMFEPFEQESGNAAAQVQGTGLGLSIVKSLVDLMHGSISVKSEVGRGTEFTVHLDMPIVEEAEADPPRVLTNSPISLKGRRVLLVEDHPLNTEIARRLLEKEGVQVTCAKNGKEALEKFKQTQPNLWDVILMDIRMPVMDGLQAARAIRALDREDAKTIPMIAMTANAFEEDVQASREAGMNAHLAKPIEPQRLYETILSFLKE